MIRPGRKNRVFFPLLSVKGDPHRCLYSQGLEKHRNCRFSLLLLWSPLSPRFGNFRFYVVSELCLWRWSVINRKFFTSVWFCVCYIKDVKVFHLLGSVAVLLMSRARVEGSNMWKQRGIVKLSGLFFKSFCCQTYFQHLTELVITLLGIFLSAVEFIKCFSKILGLWQLFFFGRNFFCNTSAEKSSEGSWLQWFFSK